MHDNHAEKAIKTWDSCALLFITKQINTPVKKKDISAGALHLSLHQN